MLIAIETATDMASVALGTSSALAAQVEIGTYAKHAESVLPALEFLLRSVGVERSAIEGIVVGAGPGSFTGVRVAAATARGLAAGLDVPLFAYSSLEALAFDHVAEEPVCALFDARRGEVYAACYKREADVLHTLLAPEALTIAALRERLDALGIRPHFTGEGAVQYASALGIRPPPLHWPRAAALLRLAGAAPAAGRIAELAGWEPSYLRASGAERGIAG